MENAIIKAVNKDFARYEELLLRRDNLKRDAENIHINYIQEFGDLITESFKIKVECIRKKKMISYCQLQMNHGKKINRKELTIFISKEMSAYEAELKSIIENVKNAKEATVISAAESKKIRTIYYSLVRKLHPDLHPDLFADKTVQEYWHRIVVAYNHSRLKELEELEALVNMYLESNGIITDGFDIKNIDEKIASVESEIENILSTAPYQYRFILDDNAEIKAKKEEYEDEIKSYREYSSKLEEILSTFQIEGIVS